MRLDISMLEVRADLGIGIHAPYEGHGATTIWASFGRSLALPPGDRGIRFNKAEGNGGIGIESDLCRREKVLASQGKPDEEGVNFAFAAQGACGFGDFGILLFHFPELLYMTEQS